MRAIAGGGRYDNLVGQLSDGAVALPALGFAMGDVVLGELLREIPAARLQMHNESQWDLWIDVYIVIAKEERRSDALEFVQRFRDQGYRVDYPLIATKVPKQFQAAEAAGARVAVLFGDEWPQLTMKNLATGEQTLVAEDGLLSEPSEFLGPSSEGDGQTERPVGALARWSKRDQTLAKLQEGYERVTQVVEAVQSQQFGRGGTTARKAPDCAA